MIRLVRIICLVALLVVVAIPWPSQADDARIVVAFANPGGKGDPFFQPMEDFMRAAADDLGFELVTYYGDRNHVVIDESVKKIFRSSPLPDYVVGMNARGSGQQLLDLAEANGVKTVLINQGFLGEKKVRVGDPGTRYSQWLFEYLPDDVNAGYLLGKRLILDAVAHGLTGPDGMVNLVAISGHETSPASTLREKGLRQAVAEHPRAKLLQTAHAGWKRDRATDLTSGLLRRYPDVTVVWSASDVMALGVVDGMRTLGMEPGRDLLTGGIDWAAPGMDSVAAGIFDATVGGHFMDGAWALVMLYDVLHGVEVAPSSKSRFSTLTAKNVNIYRDRFEAGDWGQIDFRRFSRYLNPDMKEYDFSLDAVLRQFERKS